MKQTIRNPHPFDMSNYLLGNTFVVGGVDFDRADRKTLQTTTASEKNFKLDWSFLKSSKIEKKKNK